MKIIDTHQHLWKYSVSEFAWIPEGSALAKDFIEPKVKTNNHELKGIILVQARQLLLENQYLASAAQKNELVKGIIGWLDFTSEDIEKQLANLKNKELFKGFRHLIQDELKDDFILRPDFIRGVKALKNNFIYEILVRQRHLKYCIGFLKNFPKQTFVLNHIGKPEMSGYKINKDWEDNIRVISQFPNLYCKVSGLFTEVDNIKNISLVQKYLAIIYKYFGEDRLLWGSDYPVCLLANSYDATLDIIEKSFPFRSLEKIMYLNAKKVYKIK